MREREREEARTILCPARAFHLASLSLSPLRKDSLMCLCQCLRVSVTVCVWVYQCVRVYRCPHVFVNVCLCECARMCVCVCERVCEVMRGTTGRVCRHPRLPYSSVLLPCVLLPEPVSNFLFFSLPSSTHPHALCALSLSLCGSWCVEERGRESERLRLDNATGSRKNRSSLSLFEQRMTH